MGNLSVGFSVLAIIVCTRRRTESVQLVANRASACRGTRVEFQEEMAMPEQFSLRWNDFHSNLSQSFHALLEGEDLVDVTLAAGGQYVHAHKLILSVCSPYFKELFKV